MATSSSGLVRSRANTTSEKAPLKKKKRKTNRLDCFAWRYGKKGIYILRSEFVFEFKVVLDVPLDGYGGGRFAQLVSLYGDGRVNGRRWVRCLVAATSTACATGSTAICHRSRSIRSHVGEVTSCCIIIIFIIFISTAAAAALTTTVIINHFPPLLGSVLV